VRALSVRVPVRVYERQEHSHRRERHSNHGSPATDFARAHRVGRGFTIGCASAPGTGAPFLHHLPPLPLPAHRHAFRLSLKPDRTARDHPSCAWYFLPDIPFFLSFPSFFLFSERRICVCHMTISDENIVEWLLNPFSDEGRDSASSGDPLSSVTSAQTSPG